MVVTSTWDLESSKDSISLSEDLKTFELRNTLPQHFLSRDASARMKLKERLLLSLREEYSAKYEIKELLIKLTENHSNIFIRNVCFT